MDQTANWIFAHGTFWSLVPALAAITLALVTKEVYSSLLLGILIGGFFISQGGFDAFWNAVFSDGMIKQISDPWNAGILVFVVILGIEVALMNKAGGAYAFGDWAMKYVKSKTGAQIATIILGLFIFVDDAFNCLTVGNVMRPVTDKYKVSREKLAYLLDSTAAPICIIAPISSWAAAVTGFVDGEDGLTLFVKAIPYNFYALLTIVMLFAVVLMNVEFGPMKDFKFSEESLEEYMADMRNPKGRGGILDFIVPVVSLILFCILGMVYTGGFFAAGESHKGFVDAFANSNASIGLVLGSFVAFAVTVFWYLVRRVLNLTQCMDNVVEGFKVMVPAISILVMAWTLKGVTDVMGAKDFVAGIVSGGAASFMNLMPALIFVISIFLAFSTGTSWGTFGILIPILVAAFSGIDYELMIISISACMAGAVCGDHCSPISDTTVMASAGAQCKHLDHVRTQLPYVVYMAALCVPVYILVGFTRSATISLLVGIILVVGGLYIIKKRQHKTDA